MLNIRKISPHGLNPAPVKEALQEIPSEQVGCNNWANQFPYTPNVTFKIAHDGMHIFLQFDVKENEIVAIAKGNHSAVWKDSCVEFFISFDDSGYYYNLEQSCIGEALFGYQQKPATAIYANNETMDSIKRFSSLGNSSIELRSGDFHWTLLTIIPIKAFWKSNLKSFNGIKANANFYKCGDNLTTPHYLSWAPIKSDRPNFHKIEFFKKIHFE